jgi:hypothetical protein
MSKNLPKRLRQAKAEYQRQQLQQQHQSCPKETRATGPHLGLYCITHSKWLRWLPKQSGSQI